MKAQIHPQYNSAAQVVCSCGNQFTVGSTRDGFHVELCYKCHPFYTGTQKFVDTASRIDKFQKKMAVAQPRKDKKARPVSDDRPKSLREMLQALKK